MYKAIWSVGFTTQPHSIEKDTDLISVSAFATV